MKGLCRSSFASLADLNGLSVGHARRQFEAWNPIMTAEHTEIQFVLGLDVSCNTVTLYDDHSRCTLTVANDADALRTALQPYQGHRHARGVRSDRRP